MADSEAPRRRSTMSVSSAEKARDVAPEGKDPQTLHGSPPTTSIHASGAARGYALSTWIGAGLLALLGMLFLSRQRALVSLPESYAICSKEGLIYTVDQTRPQVECVVVGGTNVLDSGSLVSVRQRWSGRAGFSQILDALSKKKPNLRFLFVKPGHIVVPGLADAHAHVLEYGFKKQLELDGSQSIQEVLQRVKHYISSHPDVLNDKTRWVQGMGWDQTKWHGSQMGRFPTAADFDAEPLLRGRPIALQRVDGHASWVSSTVLELIGELPDKIDGGSIIRDDHGKATGIFVDNAMFLIPTPTWTEQEMMEYFATTMRDSLAHGLTSIHDASTYPPGISFFKKMADENKLPLRLYLMGRVDSDKYWGQDIPKLVDYGAARKLNLRSVKLFTDGALGSWGAALLQPYTDRPDTSGLLTTSPGTLLEHITQFWKDGFQTNVHCIGDRANNIVLDIFEKLLRDQDVTTVRPRIEHAQIMHPDDLNRTARLGVIPSVQPTHATSDMWYAEDRLGPTRPKGAYAYRTLLESSRNNVLAIGSDFPIEGVNPLLGFYAAVSRLSVDGTSPHGPKGWFAEQRLSRAQALKGMTLDAAYASFAEKELGSLTPGKRADFVVLDTNIMTAPFADILETKVQATVIDGRVLYGRLV